MPILFSILIRHGVALSVRCMQLLSGACLQRFLAGVLCMVAVLPLQAREVRDLALGVALYEFFQQHDFQALGEIMLAEEQGRFNEQADFASQLAAGIMLSYGMDEAARERLAAIANPDGLQKDNSTNGNAKTDNAIKDQENRARASYFLAKLLYRKGQHAEAGAILERIDSSLSAELVPEMAFLMHSSVLQGLHSQLSNESSAARSPAGFGLDIWANYIRYNRSMAEVSPPSQSAAANATAADTAGAAERTGSIARLQALAAKLSRQLKTISQQREPERFAELLAMRDRSLLSVAYLFLLEQQPAKAIEALRQYSADGVEFGEALLAYGWAELQRQNYSEAVLTWSVLADGDIAKASTRESLLGLAHVHELNREPTQALTAYDQAIQRFGAEIQALDVLIGDAAETPVDSSLTTALHTAIADLQQHSSGWLDAYQPGALRKLNADSRATLQRLHALITTNEFAVLLNQRRDVAWLRAHSERWQRDIAALDDALNGQRQRFTEVFDAGQQDGLRTQLQILEQKLTQTEQLLAQARQRDLQLLMTAAEREHYQRARRVQTALVPLLQRATDTGHGELQDSLASRQATAKLLAGDILWRVSQDAEGRLWAMEKQRRAAVNSLNEAVQQLQSIEILLPEQASQAANLAKLSQHAANNQRIASQLQQLEAVLDQRLGTLIHAELQQQRALLVDYLGQAEYAKARLLDERFMQRDHFDADLPSETEPARDKVLESSAERQASTMSECAVCPA